MLLGPSLLLLPAALQDPAAAAPPPQPPPQEQQPAAQQPPPQPAPQKPRWTASLDAYWTDPPAGDGYTTALLYVDRGQLHLEARYAYEDRDTASFFAGWSIPFDGAVHGSVTPMAGFAAGDTDGVIPAVSLDLGWKTLRLTSDWEYLIATSSDSDDFAYSWNELTWSPIERLTVGLVAQRTNLFDQELDVDRGFLAGVGLGPMWLTAYWFNPDQDDPYWVVGVGAGF
jgi:hypothetical protein